jgi:AraC-like DNA-binding protein
MMSIHERLYWEHLGVAAALAISLFVILGLVLRLLDTSGPKMHIWAMLAFFGINTCDTVNSLAYSSIFATSNALFRWNDVLIPGFLVSLYFYVRALTSSNPELGKRDLVHLVPFVAGFICLSPNLVLPGDVRRGSVEGPVSELHRRLIDVGDTAFWSLWIGILVVYGTLCVRQLVAHKHNIRDVFSDLDGKTLRWLDGLVATIFVLSFFVILDEVRILLGQPSVRDGIMSLIYDVVLAGSFGIFALRAQPPMPDWSQEIIEPEQQGAKRIAAPPNGEKRYARSGLQPADIDRLATRLERRMAEGQLWRNHSLNLQGLASGISIPPIHLSEVLNTKLGMSFYDYVNQCRIRDACALLIQTDETVLAISETVGFNAKSTFNTRFKKVTDQTPTEWRRTHRP